MSIIISFFSIIISQVFVVVQVQIIIQVWEIVSQVDVFVVVQELFKLQVLLFSKPQVWVFGFKLSIFNSFQFDKFHLLSKVFTKNRFSLII